MSSIELGMVTVVVTDNDPGIHHWAQMIADKIVSAGEMAPPLIVDQVRDFKKDIMRFAEMYIKAAIKSDRLILAHWFEEDGQKEVADTIRNM